MKVYTNSKEYKNSIANDECPNYRDKFKMRLLLKLK